MHVARQTAKLRSPRQPRHKVGICVSILKAILHQGRKFYRKLTVGFHLVRRVTSLLRKIFEGCAKECVVLDDEFGKLPPYSWFCDSYKSSIVEITEDFSFAMDTTKCEAKKHPQAGPPANRCNSESRQFWRNHREQRR